MLFTIEEFKHFLAKQKTIEESIENLNKTNILDANPMHVRKLENDNVEINENLERYERLIGMTQEKKYQTELYTKTCGKEGRTWLALIPKWYNDKDSSFKIGYWVNYGDNDTCGFFTVEQIREWFNNPKIKLYELGGQREK